ncbi:MAG: NAD(P)/FAD-dependent oxidoreductase [Planctomycetota bacterium]|nr:MAG: NAD(P)/FAD-dependent oxidoreductase [Planctomycetota bacterium]
MREAYDCIVLGGGPAGTAAAALVAEAGHATLLVEREKTPRFHVGESLMPETYWTFERLGILDELKSSRFTRKLSVQFVNARGKASKPFYFHEHDGRDCSQTWQVRRSEFDRLLWDNAAAKGADCYDQTRVIDVALEGDRATGVTLTTADGETRQVAARVVIDASGQQSLIANRLNLLRPNPRLRKSAIWTYYRGAERAEGIDGGATVILHTEDKENWFWYIPLHDDVTSVGLVGDVDRLFASREPPAQVFQTQLARCQNLEARLADAERVDDFHVAREFSYKAERAAGDGWVLIGDAYGFIDPIYSSGVFFALKTAEMAADCVIDALAADDVSAARLGAWAAEFDRGANLVRKLIAAFYTKEFSFGEFLAQHPEHVGNMTDLLIGRIFYDGAERIFEDMDPYIANLTGTAAPLAADR